MDETVPLRPNRANKLFNPTRLEEQTRAVFKTPDYSLSASVVGDRTLSAKLWIYQRRASKREPGTDDPAEQKNTGAISDRDKKLTKLGNLLGALETQREKSAVRKIQRLLYEELINRKSETLSKCNRI